MANKWISKIRYKLPFVYWAVVDLATMVKKFISKIRRKPAFVFWAVVALVTLACAFFCGAYWHYFSTVFCVLMAVLCWKDEVNFDDDK